MALDAIYSLDCHRNGPNDTRKLPHYCLTSDGSWLYGKPMSHDMWGYRHVANFERHKQSWRASEVVVAVMMWIAVLIHFILFAWACVDTHRRRHHPTREMKHEPAYSNGDAHMQSNGA